MDKIILIGHPNSQKIVKASRYLVEKYLPTFEVIFLNHEGSTDNWSNFVADYLETLTDKKVIFALDDYLLSGADLKKLNEAFNMGDCVKLCETTEQEHLEYPITTQYTIWNRELLIKILRQTTSPWNFELSGCRLVDQLTTSPEVCTCIYYNVHSAISGRWKGVDVDGVKKEDLDYLKEHKLI